MTLRGEVREQRAETLPLETLTGLVQAWRRHWDEVGAIQRSLPTAAKDRLQTLTADIETALAQTRHLFALEFPPETVAALRKRLDDALAALESLNRPKTATNGASRSAARRAVQASHVAVNVRAVVAAGEALEMHLQPIVSLDRPVRTPVGYEALARFQTKPYEPPNVWLERAGRAGLQRELELSCVRAALELLAALPATPYLAVNVSPETLVSAEFERLVAEVPVRRLVVEVTEHAVVREYDSLVRAIGGLRAQGLRLAVDDAGAGFASFRHVLELSPEIIKLDTHLTRGIHQDRSREALVRSLVSFAADVGSTLIAEGIESREDLMTLCDARVPFGQGYFFAHPGPLPQVVRPPRGPRTGASRNGSASTARSA
jgi:EAL domain-containing protein (putative c-di-GMP-specific phosphodiesterase class I)